MFASARLSPHNDDKAVRWTVASAQRVIDRVFYAKKSWAVDIAAVATFADIPPPVKLAIRAQYGNESLLALTQYGNDSLYAKGITHDGVVYIIAGNAESESDIEKTILHEVEGHIGIRRLYGSQVCNKLLELYRQIGGLRGLSTIANRRGIALDLSTYAIALSESHLSDDMRIRVMMDEALAHCAAEPRFGDLVKTIIGGIRAWFRDHGLAKLSEYGETDLLNVIRKGKDAVAENDFKPLHKQQDSMYGQSTVIDTNLHETSSMVHPMVWPC